MFKQPLSATTNGEMTYDKKYTNLNNICCLTEIFFAGHYTQHQQQREKQFEGWGGSQRGFGSWLYHSIAHLSCRVYSTWNDMETRAIRHYFLPEYKNAAHCSETWPVQVLCSTAWKAASEMGVIVQQSNDRADGGEMTTMGQTLASRSTDSYLPESRISINVSVTIT